LLRYKVLNKIIGIDESVERKSLIHENITLKLKYKIGRSIYIKSIMRRICQM
jgi:hypothetical protein